MLCFFEGNGVVIEGREEGRGRGGGGRKKKEEFVDS
jgi:hypothetical protein